MAERCGHCGRENSLEDPKPLVVDEVHEEVMTGGYLEEISIQSIAQVERCGVCGGLTISRYQWVDGFTDPEDVVPERIYPEQRDLSDLPERVRERYSAALELQHAPDAFAVRAGRLLEAVCAEQGVLREGNHKVLADRLDELVARGGVPEPLVDQAHLVRDYRNIGGHDNEDLDVEEADVPLIREFVEALLTYLYWGPARLARGRAELEKRRGGSS